MNKKLINGLLLLAVATSGATVFTSCKDNEDATLADVYQNQKGLADKLQDKDAELARRIKALEDGDYLTLADREYLLGLINDNANYTTAVKEYLDAKLKSMITSIEIQRVYNNMFGTLNLPFGINSTVLANYYYEAKNAVVFPDEENPSANEYDLNEDAQEVAAWDLGVAPEGVVDLPANEPYLGEDGQLKLGKIYVTLNPVLPGDAFPSDGLEVSLVTSKEKPAVSATLKLVEEGDDDAEFTFGGGTRSAENGLYCIEVPAEAGDLANIEVTLDEGLKQAVKDFYHDQTKSNLADIAKGVYDQLVNTNLPAYALKLGYPTNPKTVAKLLIKNPGATFDANGNVVRDANGDIVYDGTGSVTGGKLEDTDAADIQMAYLYSKYNIAVATVHPLSFGTGAGVSIDRKLPTFGRIKDAINDYFDKLKDKVKIEIKPSAGKSWEISFDESKFTVNIDNIEIDLTGVPVYEVDANGNSTGKIIGTVGDENNPVKIVLDKDGKTGEIDGVRYASIKQLIDAINGPMDEVENVISQVNDIMADINKQLDGINGQIKDIISDIQNDFNNKLDNNNSLIDLYNKVVNKVNTLLKDPNHYLQVYAAYKENGGGLHHFSTSLSDPSLYSGDKGFKVYLTSYNGEILVPAFKKILTVSNVYKDGAQASNAASLLQKANSGADLNKVLDGERHIVEVTGLEKGYTYELFYSALDYRGVTSSRKYYIEVK